MIMAYQKNLASSILFAILLLAITSTVSLIGTAFASTENATTTSDGTSVTGNTGETPAPSAPSNASKMNGVIASIQLDENGNPAWITSGHWNLESDIPLI